MVNAFEKAFSLEGELALITGGGTGLGFAMAKCFVQAGARVVIAGRREDVLAEAVRELGPKAAYRVFDVTDTAHAVSFVEELSREMGPVTILVNNAGRHCKKPMLDVTQEDLQAVLDVHPLGAFALTKAVVPAMLERGKGSILLISSMSAYLGMTQVSAYSAAKSAVLGLVKTLSGDLADKAFIDCIHIQAVDMELQFIFRHPVGMIIAAHLKGVAAGCGSLLVADPRLSLAVTGQNKEDMVRDFLVDLFQHRFIKLRIIQTHLEHFNLGHYFARSNIQCRRCQLISPVHQPDLIDKHTA